MKNNRKSIIVIGFNTRPLVYSLFQAGFKMYAVDFFGDSDLYPYVEDCIIITKVVDLDYHVLNMIYQTYFVKFTFNLLNKFPNIDYLLIGSGLDDLIDKRKSILEEVAKKQYSILSLNNNPTQIKKARNIVNIYKFLEKKGYPIPRTMSLEEFKHRSSSIDYPIVLKKKRSSGGINIYKMDNEDQFIFRMTLIDEVDNFYEWLIQEYIEGIPISCTTISNGNDCIVISVNRQIIGLDFVNSPKKFMYCGNIVPANISRKDEEIITNISIFLNNKLGLKGINGFDFVIKNHIPYLMEINPRIPGSIRASEESLNLNLLKLHVDSFYSDKWNSIKTIIKSNKIKYYSTKLIFFAPKEISIENINKINNLKYIHDKSEPVKKIKKQEPVCTILFNGKTFADSFFGALKVVDNIKQIIS